MKKVVEVPKLVDEKLEFENTVFLHKCFKVYSL